MVKQTWLLCLFLFGIIALPVQSQVPTQATDPTTLHSCGLPVATSQITTNTTFNMTADCTYSSQSATDPEAILYITAGTVTINGNGHSFIGAPFHAIYAQGSSTIVNLNNIIIRESTALTVIHIQGGATLNASNVVFRDNRVTTALNVLGSGTQAVLRNVQFLNNSQLAVGSQIYVSAVSVSLGATVTITDGIFRGNRNAAPHNIPNYYDRSDVLVALGSGSTITLAGCMTFAGNLLSDGRAADDHGTAEAGNIAGTVVTSGITGACPSEFSYWRALTPKPKKKATPRPSATARPLATTCIDLHQATGIAVRATYGLASGVQCQRLTGGGIGIQSIVEAGFIDAVDIWGYVEQGVEVCFPQLGELLFLDARTMPRAAAPLASTAVNGMTCGAIETPGSIVLMPHS